MAAPQPKTTVAEFLTQFNRHPDPEKALRPAAEGQQVDRLISEPTVNRPGMLLAGFSRYFAPKRVQVIGNLELSYLDTLAPEVRRQRYKMLLRYPIPCVVFTRGHRPEAAFIEIAQRYAVPVFKCSLVTRDFINRATLVLDELFAPRGKEMGSMVDILGIGVIIKGESGIGKSECVLGLIERGYALVADDITDVKLLDQSKIIGTAPDLTQNLMEVRGIGIIDVEQMFGVKHIRSQKQVDLIVTLAPWEKVEEIERVGMDDHSVPVLGVELPHITIPVRPGRDIARLVEVAAMHLKMKRFGHNPAKTLNDRLIHKMAGTPE